MEVKKIVNLLRKVEGYIGFNAEYANEIADALEEFERKKENLIDYNADLNNRLDKAESYIEKLEKQLSEKQEWISVEDERKPNEGEKIIVHSETGAVSIRFYFAEAGFPRFPIVTHWMKYEPPKQKKPTFMDVLLEKFPKAKPDEYGDVGACRNMLFGIDGCSRVNKDMNCKKC